MDVTTFWCLDLSPDLYDQAHTWVSWSTKKYMARQDVGPNREPTTSILLNVHIILIL